ncbi:hypothetical protein Tco_1144964 [Tanacetum coccineum]
MFSHPLRYRERLLRGCAWLNASRYAPTRGGWKRCPAVAAAVDASRGGVPGVLGTEVIPGSIPFGFRRADIEMEIFVLESKLVRALVEMPSPVGEISRSYVE